MNILWSIYTTRLTLSDKLNTWPCAYLLVITTLIFWFKQFNKLYAKSFESNSQIFMNLWIHYKKCSKHTFNVLICQKMQNIKYIKIISII